MNVYCTICARGGSKGVKDKNIRPLAGVPLIGHTIRTARESGLFSLISVSSNDPKILNAAQEHGADILIERPESLATDTAAKIPAIQHCLTETEKQGPGRADIVFDLDATSPLRNVDDLRAVYDQILLPETTNVITAAPARRSPYFNLVECDENGAPHLSKSLPNAVSRRQASPKCYDMNASIYAWKRDALFDMPSLFGDGTRMHVMPEDRSQDIDSELDFEIVEMLMRKRMG